MLRRGARPATFWPAALTVGKGGTSVGFQFARKPLICLRHARSPAAAASSTELRSPTRSKLRRGGSDRMDSMKFLFLIFLFLPWLTFAAAPAAPPNILVVIADQWRAQAFGYAGDPNVQTPNLDRFERQSVHFTQAVAGMPVCSPTRASLLTGQRPQTHGIFINDVPLATNGVTLPKVLKAAGYDTGCIGKWHIDGHGSRSAFIPRERRQGFDYWKVLECTHAYNNSPYYADGPEKLKWDGYDAIAQTRDAQAYLRGRTNSEKPFLLSGWLIDSSDPHRLGF